MENYSDDLVVKLLCKEVMSQKKRIIELENERDEIIDWLRQIEKLLGVRND